MEEFGKYHRHRSYWMVFPLFEFHGSQASLTIILDM